MNLILITCGAIIAVISSLIYLRLTSEKTYSTDDDEEEDDVPKKISVRLTEHEGWELSVRDRLLLSGGSFIIMLTLSFALNNLFVTIAGGIIAYILPKYIIKRNRKIDYRLKIKLLRPALQAIASAHTFKPNIIAAIQYAVLSMQDPIKKEFELLLSDVEMSIPLAKALGSLVRRVNIKYLDFFVRIVIMTEEEGGTSYDLIKACVEIIEQDMLVMEEFEAEIASEKKISIQLLLYQYIMLAFLSISQPHAFEVFTGTLAGRILVTYIFISSLFIYLKVEKLTDTSLEEVQKCLT